MGFGGLLDFDFSRTRFFSFVSGFFADESDVSFVVCYYSSES